MPANSISGWKTRWRSRLLLLLLQIPVMSLCGADKWLAPSQMPAGVARRTFTPLGRLAGTNQLRLTLALPLRDGAGLTNLLAAIYRPGSPQYHHYLKPHEFAARFGPTAADYAAIMQFAVTNGLRVTATHASRLLLDVSGPVADVERAFHVKLYRFRHPTEARDFFAPASEPRVDARLPLLQVSGLNNYFLPHPNVLFSPGRSGRRVSPSGGSSPDGTYMGNDFRQAYVPGTALTGAGQNVGLLQFDGFYPTDITNYITTIGLTNDVPQVVVEPVDGGVTYPGTGSVEAALDIEMVLSMSPGVSNIYVYEAPVSTPWVDILSQMADEDLAAQLSCSWSGGDPDPAAEQIFEQMAAQGQSFFNATGDIGAFDGVVPFPSESPNITEVGGTYLVTDTNGNYLEEAVWNRGGGVAGSGGIGCGVVLPAWQLGLDMGTNDGSTVWRDVPDVALTADEIYVIADGQSGLAGGTSCAAPLWAGLTALINEQAAQLGQPPVGFLNPALYALCRGTNYGAMFHDITAGNNTNWPSATDYCAEPGYDLCTGWGTPAGTNLINGLTTPDSLGILPPDTFSTSGLVGGPFPQTNWMFTLTNSGTDCLDWSLGGVPEWLAVSATGGTLAASGTTNICVQLVDVNTLPASSYSAVLSVTNLALSAVQSVGVQLDIGQSVVQNGGFEAGDFTGWTLVGDTATHNLIYNAVMTDAVYPGIVHSGYFGAFLGETGYAATLSQTLTTVPGQQYTVSWWLDNPQSGSVQSFSANWNGTNLVSLADPTTFLWTNFQFVATASDTNTLLEFAAENDGNYFGLDDVSVTPVPLALAGCCASTNGFQFSWPSRAGLNYLVQYKTNLADNWLDLCPIAAGTNYTTFADTNAPDPCGQRFYRLILLAP